VARPDTQLPFLKAKHARLTGRERTCLVGIAEECLKGLKAVQAIREGIAPDSDWVAVTQRLQESLNELADFVRAIPSAFQPILTQGPDRAAAGFGLPGLAWKQHVKGQGDEAGTFLNGLLRFLRRTKTKGPPGRRPKYPMKLVQFVNKLRAQKRPPTWKDVLPRCKERFPDVDYPKKLTSFKDHMQRLRREGGTPENLTGGG
jgi:hypothetical protein